MVSKATDIQQCSPDSSCLSLRLPEESRIEADFPTFSRLFIFFVATLVLMIFLRASFQF